MTLNELNKLADLIKRYREALLAQWREQVRQLPSAKHLNTPTLNDHIPTRLDELVTALYARAEQTIPDALLDGGQVTVESRQGSGSTFRCSLPSKANLSERNR